MAIWLRQVAVLVADRDATVARLAARFGLDVCTSADRIEGYAMANALLPVGRQFLEVASPLDDATPAARLLARRGDTGYLVVIQTDDFDAARRRVEAAGALVTIALEHVDARELHLHPRTTGGVALAIDWMAPEAAWKWAGADWESHIRTDVVEGIAGMTLAADDPSALAARWSALLGAPVASGDDELSIPLRDGWVRFARRPGPPALTGIHLAGAAGTSMRIGDVELATGA